ncbi:MAG: PAS domain S-box protein, partial [Desulfobacterales bacterium]|nr:PAS domain S-box protein [Desulfobacterales bacterium]
VFILVAPAVIGLGVLAVGVYQHEREQISQSTLATARSLMAALDRDMAGFITASQVLAESPFLKSGDFAAFHREAASIVPIVHGSTFVLTDATGQQIVNTLRPYGELLPLSGNSDARNKVFQTGQPAFSDLFIGAITKLPTLTAVVPVFQDNQVKYALAISASPARLTDLLLNQMLPPDWVATITDSSGVIIARSRRPDLVGQRAPVRLSAIAQSRSGVVEVKSMEGLPVFVGFSKSDLSDWTVSIGVPLKELSRKPNAVLLYGAVAVLGVLLIGLMMAVYESRRVARAVQGLIPSTLALGRGEAPAVPASNIRETDEVAQALTLVHQLLQERTLERDHAELTIAARSLADEMFRLAVEACPNGMVMIDAQGKIILVNTEIEHQFGYAREELIGQPVDILVPERMRTQHARHRHDFAPKPETRRMGAGRDLFGRRKDGSEFPVEVG